MELHISKTNDEVISSIANFITTLAKDCVSKEGRFTWALSGGSSPKRLFEMLSAQDKASLFPWNDTFFFFGDERYVPLDDDDSNYRMAKLAMLDKMNIPADHVFPVNTSLSPEGAASHYENDIVQFFGNENPVFDLIMLGLGDDAHTASLFPFTTVLTNDSDLVSDVFLPDKKIYRITFTKKLINNAGTVAFLTFGANKAEAVWHVLEDNENTDNYPAQLIRPHSGNLYWFMDDEAAGMLKNNN